MIGETICSKEKKFVLSAERELENGYYTLLAKSYDEHDKHIEDGDFSISIISYTYLIIFYDINNNISALAYLLIR